MMEDKLNSSIEKVNSRLGNFEEDNRVTMNKFYDLELKMNNLETRHK